MKLRSFALLATALLVAITVASCGGTNVATTQAADTTITSPTATLPPTTEPAPAGSVSSTDAASSTTTGPPVTESPTALPLSRQSIAYAEELGGIPHLARDLYLVIGASVKSEDEAQQLLEKALPSFGDMQSYFIVQKSDNFEGLNPGWWIVSEAYYAVPDGDQIDFGRRGFPDAYVKRVTVLTEDPIPVYEDMVGNVTMDIIHDVIAQSGQAPAVFDIVDYSIGGDWAGVVIAGAELEIVPVLLYHSGLKGWTIVDMGGGFFMADLIDQGVSQEVAAFLACDT